MATNDFSRISDMVSLRECRRDTAQRIAETEERLAASIAPRGVMLCLVRKAKGFLTGFFR